MQRIRFSQLLQLSLLLTTFLLIYILISEILTQKARNSWQVKSIDTVKYSRDLGREMPDNGSLEQTVAKQVKSIAQTGVTHLAIGTPYDEEFVPVIKLWVQETRKHNLKVWYRGNFSGWEGWFDYPKIDAQQHLQLTEKFILNNKEIFEDGDIFTSCTECENGSFGDPRKTSDLSGYRQFLIAERRVAQQSFERIGKEVKTGYFPMNYDVARLVMDKQTTDLLGGTVVIDHYVKDPEQLSIDVTNIAKSSGGKVILGEFGVPIPDIHQEMSENQQAQWIDDTLQQLVINPDVVGVNYWVSWGGSTALWKDDGEPKNAVTVICKYFKST